MAISKPSSEVFGSKRLFTGIGDLLPVAVNPTKAELEKFGIIPRDEPKYSFPDHGFTTVKFLCELKNAPKQLDSEGKPLAKQPPVYIYVSFNLTDEFHEASTGKIRVLNDFGNDNWATPEEIAGTANIKDRLDWYDTDGMRKAKRGEVELIQFIRAWYNLFNKTGEKILTCNLDSIDKIMKGDVKELRELIKANVGDQVVRGCLGVKETDNNKTYQDVFTKYFMPFHATSNDRINHMRKTISESQAGGASPNVTFGPADMKIREYNATATPSADTDFDKSEIISSDW